MYLMDGAWGPGLMGGVVGPESGLQLWYTGLVWEILVNHLHGEFMVIWETVQTVQLQLNRK